MRCLLLTLFLISSLFEQLYSYDLEEIKIQLNTLKGKSEELNFLQDNEKSKEDEDKNYSFEETIIRKGYPLASYYINTDDGYVLKLYRISGPKYSTLADSKTNNTKVVLLQHGLLDSSDSWIANHEEKSLAFILANSGYDVWLGNNRGNKYSRSHLKYNPDKDNEFWRFSFHEMGRYDLPAMLNFIQKLTNTNKKITYVGHSQGTSQLFAGMTLLPEFYKEKLNGFLALGPVTSMKNVNSTFLKYMVDFHLDQLFFKLGISELFRNSQSISFLEKFLCSNVGLLCEGALELIADLNAQDDDLERFIVFLSHFPSGSSIQTFMHFAQSIRHQNFASLGTMIPYDFTKINDVPIALFVGADDRLATVADNRILKSVLEENKLLSFYKEYENTGHASFFISSSNNFMSDILIKVKEFSS